MREQPRDGVVFAFQFLFGKQLVNLRMAWATNADHAPHDRAFEFALVPFVVMPGARNEMVPRERFFAAADRALSEVRELNVWLRHVL